MCCRNGSEIANSHAISALLDSHPSLVDVALDIPNAFNSISRGAFLPIVASHFPDLLPWVNSMYAEPTYLFFGGKPDKLSTVITSSRGTRLGCPLEAQLFALGLHPHLCALARLVGENGSVIAYADDIHLIGSPATVGLALSSLTQMSTPVEALSLDCRHPSLGLALSPGKTSILLGKEATPEALESGFGSDLLTRLDATICHG